MLSHTSDVLRFTVISKAGGMYIDYDFIALRPFLDLKNFIALEVSH